MDSIDSSKSLKKLVAERPNAAKVLAKWGIDCCCGGDRTIAEACIEGGLDMDAVLQDLFEMTVKSRCSFHGTASQWKMTDLTKHIESTHHAFCRHELPRICLLVEQVSKTHRQEHPELGQLRRLVFSLKDDLELHMLKEEQVLFPWCRRLEEGVDVPAGPLKSIANPIKMLEAEHQEIESLTGKVRAVTNDFEYPSDGCSTYQLLMDSLKTLYEDFRAHIHKENNLLFPLAIGLESDLLQRSMVRPPDSASNHGAGTHSQ